jgi:nucleotide-binding universal stress UspA family protein
VISNVVVGTDGSDTAARAVGLALDLSERFSARLIAASAYVPEPECRLKAAREEAPADIEWAINPSGGVDAMLRDVQDEARARGIEATPVARTGDPADVLCEIADDYGADVLVVGSQGMQRRLLGSVPNTVSHRARCSVLIVRTD